MSPTDWKLVRLVDLALINAKSISGKYPYEEIEYIPGFYVAESVKERHF